MTDVDQDYGDDDVNLIEDAPTAADAPDDAGDDAQGDPAPTAPGNRSSKRCAAVARGA